MNSVTSISTTTTVSRNKSSRLSPEHQKHIAERGLLDNNWTEMTCYTTSAKNATSVLGYPAMSGGIMFWGYNNQYQFRPDTPWESEDGECPKYRTPKGGYDALLLRHLTDDRYWELDHLKEVCWKINGHPCILVTDGGFKAIAGCSNGIPTIALLGVEMGLTGAKHDPDNKRYLVSSIKKYAEAGLGFIIAFDADATSNPDIHRAEKTLAIALKEYNVPVYTVTGHWKPGDNGETKGMDDFIQKKGIEAFRAILIKAESVDAKSLDTSHSKKAKHPSADAMARTIAEDYRDRLKFNNTNLCWYRYEADSPGIWSPETDEYIESVVYQIVKSKGLTNLPPTYVGAAVRFLRHELIERQWKSRTDLIPFTNGALEIATGKLLPHSPGYHFTWTLPRAHCAVASDWQKIEGWLDFATQGNQHVKNLLIAFCNAVLKGRADLQKALHLIGIGGSGKGSFCRLVIALIGIENTHSSSLDDWSGNRFEVAQAYEKRLLLFPDEDKGARQLSKFKQVTAGDWLRAEEKGKKPFKFKFGGMVAVASNFPIFGSDNSSGMARRIIPVPFNAVVAAGNRRDLDSTFEPELAAFTNHLLSLDDAWVERTLRGVVEIPEINLQGWENKIREDSVAGFLNDRLIYDPLSQTSIGDSAYAEGSLYQAYDLYCSDQGHKAQAVKNFSPNLVELASVILGWQVEKIHTRVGKVIKGIRLRTKADEHIPTYDCELHSRCDGCGDGSVTDSVTGQNPCSAKDVTDVTDRTLYQPEKMIDNIEVGIEAGEGVQTENIQGNIDFYPSHPSPEPEPLPIVNLDPSHYPSRYPSPHPSQLQNHANKRLASKLADDMREAVAEGNREKAKEIVELVKASAPQVRGFFDKCLSQDEKVKIRLLKNSNLVSEPVAAKQTHLAIGDLVEITLRSDYQGQKGEIVDIGYGSAETDYYVGLENEKVILSVPRDKDQFTYLRKLEQ